MEIREGLFRVPASLPKVDRHAEAGERVYQGFIHLIKRVFQLQGLKVTIVGAENIPQFGGALMACNHTGYYDFIFAGAAPYMRGHRLTRFLAKKEIFDIPVVKWLLKPMKHVPVDRAAGAGAINSAVEHLQSGRLVALFPEATISRSFELREFKNGAARIAHQARVPLIPMVVWGSQRIWTKGGVKHLGRSNTPVYVRVGQAIEVTGDWDKDTRTLKQTMSELLDQVRADYAAEYGPFDNGLEWMPAALGGSAPTLEEANRMDEAERAARQQAREDKALYRAHRATAKEERKIAKRVKKAWRRLRRDN
ncbi:lysophospholipid acyltransferase family protein [Corynebacterium phocae]|nr:lysophospholipid acyltransferase family protein [Corynebacterium phocae]KAA8721124.1 1-acyl-sn-glycerol-3-phosphate acyltransferase [Corynebacterium phocae]